MLAALIVAACAPIVAPPAPAPTAVIGDRFREERRAVLDALNLARARAGVVALAYDSTLEHIGDRHCRELVADGCVGHFSTDGVPPYLGTVLAGHPGYHRQNVASHSHGLGLVPGQLNDIILSAVAEMMAETPPNDGHRRAILEPTATHVGIGLAVEGSEVRVTHELATVVTRSWQPPSVVALPGTVVSLAGQLANPWQVAAVELLWEALPQPLTREEANRIRSYRYPPRRGMFFVGEGLPGLGSSGRLHTVRADRAGTFAFAWRTGPTPGVELAVVWAHRSGGERQLTAVALGGTVVTVDGALPPALARRAALREPPAEE